MNSDSVEDVATVSWSLVLYATAAPANLMSDPVKDLRVRVHAAQSASLIPCAVVASWSGRGLDSVSSLSELRRGGGGVGSNSGRGDVRQ